MSNLTRGRTLAVPEPCSVARAGRSSVVSVVAPSTRGQRGRMTPTEAHSEIHYTFPETQNINAKKEIETQTILKELC